VTMTSGGLFQKTKTEQIENLIPKLAI